MGQTFLLFTLTCPAPGPASLYLLLQQHLLQALHLVLPRHHSMIGSHSQVAALSFCHRLPAAIKA